MKVCGVMKESNLILVVGWGGLTGEAILCSGVPTKNTDRVV